MNYLPFARSMTSILALLYRSQPQSSSRTPERRLCSSAVTVQAIAS